MRKKQSITMSERAEETTRSLAGGLLLVVYLAAMPFVIAAGFVGDLPYWVLEQLERRREATRLRAAK